MAKTENELVVATLNAIGAVGAGQSASSADIDRGVAWVAPMLADLAARNVVYIADSDDIPDEYFPWLVRILAYWVSPDFGAPSDESSRVVAEDKIDQIVKIGQAPRDVLKFDLAVSRGFR